jgi:hypothetical protein
MSETILDYEKENRYLPQSLRAFVGATDRMATQNFNQFFTMYSGYEQLAVFNNRVSAEFASGFNRMNFQYLRSGVAPRLLQIFVSKTVGKLYYQTQNDEAVMNNLFDSNYFSNIINKATTESAQTGRSAIVVYGSKENPEELDVLTYNLFRHRLAFDRKGNVNEAWLYIVNMEDVKVGFEYVICEHRFYKTKNDDKGNKIKVPYQEYLVYSVTYTNQSKTDAKRRTLEAYEISDAILQKFPNVEFNNPKELDMNSIGVFNLDYTLVNTKFPDLNIPESMFVDAVDNALVCDTSLTDKEVEKEIGRGQILIPEFAKMQDIGYQANPLQGMMMRRVEAQTKNPILQKYPTMSMEDSKPTNVQFDIRAEQWDVTLNSDVARLCASVGISVLDYDPRLLQQGQRTDDEINAMTDITANTVQRFRNINELKINQFLECVGYILGIPQPIAVRWSMASILNPTKNADLVTKLLTNGLISRKEAIRRANPDLTDNEVDEMIKQIDSEQDSRAVPMAFNNF